MILDIHEKIIHFVEITQIKYQSIYSQQVKAMISFHEVLIIGF